LSASSKPVSLPLADAPFRAETIYRPFFKAGIAVTLSLGSVWGAYLLVRIALNGSFTAAGLHEVNAHGHAQIFGRVGLFVMGFAYQAFPRFKQTTLSHPEGALVSLWLMLAGIIGRSALEPLASTAAWAGPAALVASVPEVTAILLFVSIIAATWRGAGKPLAPSDYYILSSLAWFIVQAVYESAYLAATLYAAGREKQISLVATWQGALRDVQIHGFAMLMILGVSQRIFHHHYGKPDFSHAYFGAIRHAITVGFISLMIVGVAARVVPTLNGIDQGRLSKLWGLFLLLNAGCALRVCGQTMTDFVPAVFPITGLSGVLEVLGLTLWALHLWPIMSRRLRLA
jgi:hypothetical protein